MGEVNLLSGVSLVGRIPAGTWVQIKTVVLPPEGRAPQVPDDTKRVPLEMLLKGFLVHDGEVQSRVTVKTLTGRLVEGVLVDAAPAYNHGFGAAIPELQRIGIELRQIIAGEVR